MRWRQHFGIFVCCHPRLDPLHWATQRHAEQIFGGDSVDRGYAQLAIRPLVDLGACQASVRHRSVALGSGFAQSMRCADGVADGEAVEADVGAGGIV